MTTNPNPPSQNATPGRELRDHVTDGNKCWCEPETEEIYDDEGNYCGTLYVHREIH